MREKLFIKFVVIISILFLVTGCKRERTDIEKMLMASNWQYNPFPDENRKVKYVTYRKFNEDGTCHDFYVSSKIRYQEICGKSEPVTWGYNLEEKILTIATYDFEIREMKNDTLFLKRLDNNSNVALIRYKNKIKYIR